MEVTAAEKRPGIPVPVILASLFALVFCGLFSALVFERVPHVNDEIAYLFQAKLFQSGRLTAASPCGREFFDFPHIINNGKWYSIYPPGFPLLLLFGLLARAPWLVNPVLAALSVFLIFLLGREIYSRQVGTTAALLAAISPWFLVMSSTMMSHTSSLFFSSLFLLLLFRFLRRPSVGVGLAAGTSWGMAFLVRPLNALFFSFVFLVFFSLRLTRKPPQGRRRNAAAIPAAALFFVGLLLLYNTLTTGAPWRMGYLVRYGPSYSVIFGRAATLDSDFTPLSGVIQMADNLRALNGDLFGWPVSSFLAMLPLLWFFRLNPEERKKDLLLLGGIGFLIVVFTFFWGAFVFIGARMLFDALPLLLLLSARGIAEIPGLIGRSFPRLSGQTVRKATAVLILVFAVYGFAYYLPHWLRPPHAAWFFDRTDHRFAGTSGRLGRAVADLRLGRALVILKFWHRPPPAFPDEGGWGSGFLGDDPDLKSAVIFAKAREKSYAELFSCYPDRKIFVYAGTLDRGMLIPLKKAGSEVIPEEPMPAPRRQRALIEFVSRAAQVFLPYSREFSEFLDALFRDLTPLEVDSRRLEDRGIGYQAQDDFRRAAFCFEAALQVENDPRTRRSLLDRLIVCYRKTGQAEAAQRITAFLEKVGFNERRLYDVFPERGF
jgi:Dolichyl-phosphate-mannose-protein mannosyltransferase